MNKKSVLKKLKTTAENLWKEVCRLRDVVCRGPEIEENHVCGGYLQVDHAFSRTVGALFLDPRNGTLICQNLHFRKTHGIKGAEKLVDEYVRKREGEEWWAYAKSVCQSKKPHDWNVIDLEQIVISLKEQRAKFLGGF